MIMFIQLSVLCISMDSLICQGFLSMISTSPRRHYYTLCSRRNKQKYCTFNQYICKYFRRLVSFRITFLDLLKLYFNLCKTTSLHPSCKNNNKKTLALSVIKHLLMWLLQRCCASKSQFHTKTKSAGSHQIFAPLFAVFLIIRSIHRIFFLHFCL